MQQKKTCLNLEVAYCVVCGFFLLNATLKLHLNVNSHNNLSLSFLSLDVVPSQPRNVTVHDVSPSSIKISWLEPEKPNGPNLIYRIYYTFLNQTLLAMPKNDPDNGMRSESGIHYYTLKRLSRFHFIRP